MEHGKQVGRGEEGSRRVGGVLVHRFGGHVRGHAPARVHVIGIEVLVGLVVVGGSDGAVYSGPVLDSNKEENKGRS